MNLRYAPGEFRIAVLGDLLRNPMTTTRAMADRLELDDPNIARVTLRRMVERGWVRRHDTGWMLTDLGRLYIRRMRTWLSV